MRTLLKTSAAVLLFAAASISANAQGVTVYQSDMYYYPDNSYAVLPVTSGVETGDQVVLAGSQRLVTGFSFNYWASGLPSDATAQIKFYDSSSGLPSGAPLYDSGAFKVADSSGQQVVLNQSALNGGFLSKDNLAWTVTFNFSQGSVALFAGEPSPSIGGSYADYLTYTPSTGWTLMDNTSAPAGAVNFVSTISAVPEPSTLALLGLGSLAGMILIRRRK